MRRGMIYKFMIVFVALALVAAFPFRLNADPIDPTITIVTQPSDQEGQVGETVKFSVKAEGEGLSYQWQVFKNNDWANTTLSGNKTATLKVAVKESRDQMQFRCAITDANEQVVYSDPATLHVVQPQVEFKITADPSDQYGEVGETVTFTVAATGDGLTYQWQTLKGETWKNVTLAGNKSAKLSVEVKESRDGMQFRCLVTDANEVTKESGVAILHVRAADALKIVEQSYDYTGAVGEIAKLSVKASSDDVTYQWQVLKNDTWQNTTLSGNKTATLKVELKTSRDGMQFRCQVSDGTDTVYSEPVTIKIIVPLEIILQPEDFTGNVGEYAYLKVAAQGYITGYQWQVLKNGNWQNTTLSGNKTDTLKVELKETRDGMQFRCLVYGSNDQVAESEVATIRIAKNTATVTFNAGNGKFRSSGLSTGTANVDKGIYNFDYEIPEWEGHYFQGWLYNNKLVNRMEITEDIEVTASWVEVFTVTYNANGGKFENNQVTIVDETFFGNYYLLQIPAPTKDGYMFTGWTLNNNPVGSRIRVTSDVELVANWTAAVTVTYNGNGGYWYSDDYEGGKTGSREFIEAKNSRYFVDIEAPSREGYRFEGWKLNGNWIGQVTLTESMTFDAVWVKEVKITYNANGGYWVEWSHDDELDEDIRETFDDPIEQFVDNGMVEINCWWPEREGYDFLGWNIDPTATTGQYSFDYDIEEDTVFYAIWKKQGVVRYDANGGYFFGEPGNENDKKTVRIDYISDGEYYYVGCDIPDREGYDFRGWVDKDGNPVDEKELLISSSTDITIYASWSKHVKVYYNANGGLFDDNEPLRDHDVWSGENYRIGCENPFRDGFEFDGWYDVEGNFVDGTNIIIGEEDLEYFAKWIQVFQIKYDANGGEFIERRGEDITGTYTIIDREAREGEPYELDGWRPEKQDEFFMGWSYKADGSEIIDGPIDVTKNLTLYAVWYKPAVVTYITNRGCWRDGDDEVTTFTRHAYDNGDYDIDGWYPDFDNQPYRFIGYSLQENSNKVDYVPGYHFDYLDEDLTLYAVWQKMSIVTFVTDKGSFRDGETSHEEWRDPNRKYYVRHEWPEVEGFDFVCWVDADGNEYYDSDMIVLEEGKEYVFYAKFTPGRQLYNVRYDPNGGTFDMDPDYAEWDADAGEFPVGCFWPHREHYDFIGWNTDKNATTAGPDYIDLNQDTVFYAIWERHVEITLDAGEGGYFTRFVDVDGSNGPVKEQFNKDYWYIRQGNKCYTYYLPRPEKDGYIFEGWTLNGKLVNEFDPLDQDVTLVASYIKAVDITFDAGEGKFEDGHSEIVIDITQGDFYCANWIEAPSREGYEFGGWSLNGEYVTCLVDIQDDVTLEAIWYPVEA